MRRLSRFEVADAGALLGSEAIDMVSADLAVYPTPSPAHCPTCQFTVPCIDLTERGDAQAVLASSYRERMTEEIVEGRLGSVTWSMGRGAAPPQFGRR